jgi:hypothetical protein
VNTGQVPERYLGVWSRTLLKTPETSDVSTLALWMQLGQWHVDLRVPPSVERASQGFSGTTQITQAGGQEICTWHRVVDYQPPRTTVDEGWMVFETPEKVLETGIHGNYFEVWERLPGSTGRRIAAAEKLENNDTTGARLFVSGDFMMRVRPAVPLSPHFEISFGLFSSGKFSIQASTISGLKDTCTDISIFRIDENAAKVVMDSVRSEWTVLEWVES